MTNTTHTLRLIDEYLTQGGYTPGIDDVMLHDEAALVAAAPDLLAALEAVLPDLWDGIESATDQGANDAWLADALHRLDAARAAVNKAKGN
jgi:hypothetical protein